MEQILEVVVRSLASSFLQVTVFVGAVTILFSYFNYRSQGALVAAISRNTRLQPIIGALLGLSPGCGGAILVMPLYLKRQVSFGTVVATLIATSGDAAFVLLAHSPSTFWWVSVISLFVAIASGYFIDYMRIFTDTQVDEAALACAEKGCGCGPDDQIDERLNAELAPDSLGYRVLHHGYLAYWAFLTVGVVMGVALLFQVNPDDWFPYLGTTIGIIGTALSVLLAFMRKNIFADDSLAEERQKSTSLKETFIHGAQETAFVGAWVFVAYLVYELTVLGVGMGDYAAGEQVMHQLMGAAGIGAVFIGALVGLIPGCGTQIIFFALYTQGMVPFSALLANALSQDGDALFPMLVMDRKASLWLTLITTVPALIVGIIAYAIERVIS